MKATYGEILEHTFDSVNVIPKYIFKNPKTDSGFKKSAKGLLKVVEDRGKLILKDEVSLEAEASEDNLLQVVFEDGKLVREFTLNEIRERLKNQL